MITEEMVRDLLGQLIEIESPYFKEEKIIHYIHDWFLERGMPSKIHSYSEPVVTKFDGKNVIVELGKEGTSGPHIYFNAHVDTVYESLGWRGDPLVPQFVDGKMYGLGALDMKSGVAALMLALEFFYQEKPDFEGKITAHFVSDEEGPFGLGTTFLIQDKLVDQADLAIVTEPSSGFTGLPHPVVCLGARGGYNYTIKLYGLAAHAATPHLGKSALVDASKIVMALEDLDLAEDEHLGKGSSVVIRVSGGGNACSVPDYAEIEVFRHTVRGETKANIRAEVEEAIRQARLGCKHELVFRASPVEGFDGGFAPYYFEEEGHVASFIQSVQEVCGKLPSTTFFSSIGDFNHLGGKLGIPTVIFGAAGENFHSPNEYVELNSVVDMARVLLDFLRKTF